MIRLHTLMRCGLISVLAQFPFAASAVEVVQGPTLTMDPNGLTPLAGVVEMETDVPVRVQLTIDDGLDLRRVVSPEPEQQHYLPVLGLKPDRTYDVEVRLLPGGFAGDLMAVTGPLPDDFPIVAVNVSDPPNMEPGYTLLDCFNRQSGDSRPRYSIAFDDTGEVVWYGLFCAQAVRQLANGHVLGLNSPNAREWDMLGNQALNPPLANPGTGLHHDLLRTPMGTYLSIDRVEVEVPDYPTSYTDPAAPTETATVQDNPVVEFLPDGSLRREWRLTEMLDPTRIGFHSLGPTADGFDWAHANAVTYDPDDDAIIVSVRHQDAVVKFSRTTGDVIWILGPHDNWPAEFQPFLLQPVGEPFRWQYHQHAPMLTGDGTLVLFDNGNNRASPFDGNPSIPDSQNFSRGVEYLIDEEQMEVQQVWEFGEDSAETLYSGFICDADWQETTGNVLITFGAITYTDGVSSPDLGLGDQYARIIEVTDDIIPQRVFDLSLSDPDGRILVYRSERIPGLYPQEHFDAPHGVHASLMVDRSPDDSIELDWQASPVDAEHDAADYYAVYVSNAPDGGFAMLDTAIDTEAGLGTRSETEFYKIVAVNSAGTSGDEPEP